MPIYEYTCGACEARFEQLQRTMAAAVVVPCPECGSDRTRRSVSLFAVAADTAKSTSVEVPPCGRCGGPPGSCSM